MSGPRRDPARLMVEGLIVVVVGLLLWWGSGGRWVHVESPSMGTAAPVGSLLWVSPTTPDDIDVGDLVTFHAPREGRPLYTHRVSARSTDGSLRTSGDLSGDDPWTVAPDEVVGEVRAMWPGVGWLVVAAPVLLPGLLIVAGLVRMMRRGRRPPAALLLGAVLVAVALSVYRPLVDVERIATTATDGGERTAFVGTGLLPVRVTVEDADGMPGDAVVLRPGERGVLFVPGLPADAAASPALGEERVPVRIEAAVPSWWWALLLVPALLPGTVAWCRARMGARTRGARVAVPAR